MERYQLNIKTFSGVLTDFKESKRNHQTVYTLHLDVRLMEAICQYNIRELRINNFEVKVDLPMFIKMLNKLPLLKTLRALRIKINDRELENNPKVQLDHLQNLTCKTGMLRLLNVKSLKKLELDCYADLSSCGFFNFLKQQKNLQELSLCGTYSNQFFQDPAIFELECRLTHFHVTSYYQEFNHHDEFVKFLWLQQGSLKSLEILGHGKSYEIVKKFVLGNLTNLKNLRMSFLDWFTICEHLSPEEIRERYGEQNLALTPINIGRNLEILKCCYINLDVNISKFIFDALPNLKHLIFRLPCKNKIFLKNNLLYIGATLKKLESLIVDEISSSEISFPKLKNLTVYNISNLKEFNGFIRRHLNTLEKVEIVDGKIDQETVDALMNCGNLKSLAVLSETVDFPMFNAFSLKRKQFTLKLIFEGAPLNFVFPDDKLFWDSHCDANLQYRFNNSNI